MTGTRHICLVNMAAEVKFSAAATVSSAFIRLAVMNIYDEYLSIYVNRDRLAYEDA